MVAPKEMEIRKQIYSSLRLKVERTHTVTYNISM